MRVGLPRFASPATTLISEVDPLFCVQDPILTVNVCGIHRRWQHSIPSTYPKWRHRVDLVIPRKWLTLWTNKWEFASILCRIASQGPSSCTLRGLEIVSKSILPMNVCDPSVHLAVRDHTVLVMTFEALMDFKLYMDFVSEKRDHIALSNHTTKTLLTGSIRWSWCNLHGHGEHETNFNQQQSTNVRFLTILIVYRDSWRRSRCRLNIKHLVSKRPMTYTQWCHSSILSRCLFVYNMRMESLPEAKSIFTHMWEFGSCK
jgi:hypothetical protein